MTENSGRVELSSRPDRCPACGAEPVATILYGLPALSKRLQAQLDAGTVALGGCVISGDGPEWKCTHCGVMIYRSRA